MIGNRYSLPPATIMPQPISRPSMHSSISTSSLWAKAASTAGSTSSRVWTFVTPNELPLAFGLMKSGSPNSAITSSGSAVSPLQRKISRARLMPRPATVRLVVTLSNVMTEEVIEHDE